MFSSRQRSRSRITVLQSIAWFRNMAVSPTNSVSTLEIAGSRVRMNSANAHIFSSHHHLHIYLLHLVCNNNLQCATVVGIQSSLGCATQPFENSDEMKPYTLIKTADWKFT